MADKEEPKLVQISAHAQVHSSASARLTVIRTNDRYLLVLLVFNVIALGVGIGGFVDHSYIVCAGGLIVTVANPIIGPRLTAKAIRDITGQPPSAGTRLRWLPNPVRNFAQRIFAPQFFK